MVQEYHGQFAMGGVGPMGGPVPSREFGSQSSSSSGGDIRCCLMCSLISCVAFLLVCALLILAPSAEELVNGQAAKTTTHTLGSRPQPTRLRIKNGCDREALWLASVGDYQAPINNVKILPLGSRDIEIPESGVLSTRFWAKWRCMTDGNSCAIGDSGGKGQECEAQSGCAPPVDTKFEVIFGKIGAVCNTSTKAYRGCDFVDVSVKDGYTVPFALDIKGDCKGHTPKDTDNVHQIVECPDLSLDECPSAEAVNGVSMDLKATNPASSEVVGCLSPCSKLLLPAWQEGAAEKGERQKMPANVPPEADKYCCSTQEACRGGEVLNTQYVQALSRMCPGINSYPYDHGMGLGTCPAGTKYEMVFYCPKSSAGSVSA